MTTAATAQDAKPEPGKQVPQKLAVPKSTSVWQWRGGGDFAKLLATPKPLDESGTEDLQYLLFLPKAYDADAEKEWPLLLFLHGAGERGDDVHLVAVHGPPKRIAKEPEFAETCPFIVVSPQCRTDRYWSPAQLNLLLDAIEKQCKVDKRRIYVTGLSMGGFGTWMMTADRPDRFAAVAPICGGYDPEQAKPFVNVPLWAFHGEIDAVVPVKLTRDMVKAIEDAGGQKVKITLYPGVNHDSWTQTYENTELYDWFLSNVTANVNS
ncbi:MAG: prolyl oligopeptidase family serine peptidase, partial [Planctomycetaceae bacterium]|nr:prolyl oligopeptidase family serine peptidase [Planctomycetaceae bacterium]